MTRKLIRVLTLVESNTVTGPARNVIEFGKLAADGGGDLPAVEVTILTYRRGSGESALAQAAGEAGLRVVTIAERRRWDTRVLPQLRQAVAACNPDILESRNVKSHFFVRLLGLHRNYPWVAWNHGYTEMSRLDRVYTQVDRWSLPAARRVVTVCRPFADKLVSRGVAREKITILHNSVKPFMAPPPQEVQRVRTSLGLQESEAVVLSVGRLSLEKGHADLIAAAAALEHMKDVPRYRIVLVGDGPEREALLRLAARLGVANRVTLAGFQRDTNPYYSMATLVAVPSHSEGSPNVVLEAMAAGLPIAATRVGGIPEILEEGATGLMVPARDPKAMAKAIQSLLSHADLRQRLGTAAHARTEADYTPAMYRHKLVRFYQQTLDTLQ